jgi:hypothetical protein
MCLRYKSLSTVIGKVAHPPWSIPTFPHFTAGECNMLATVTLDCPDGRLKTVNGYYL